MRYTAVGDDGEILCSGDGCTGTQTSNTSKTLRSVSRSGTMRGDKVTPLILAVGDDGEIRRLKAQGQWEHRDGSTSYHLHGVSFAPGTVNAWVVGDEGTILKTTDGGWTWGFQTSGITRHLRAVQAVTDQLVYAVGDEAEILKTTDGGAHWQRIHHFSDPGLVRIHVIAPTKIQEHLRAVAADADGNMWAAGNDGGLIQFVNGDWKGQHVGSKTFRAIAHTSKGILVAGDDGTIQLGGWDDLQARSAGTGKNLNAILAQGSSIMIAGDDGHLFSSSDGGATWSTKTRGSKHLHGLT
jgi:photosystem II stability/assembly factor-like uncharacterized protein